MKASYTYFLFIFLLLPIYLYAIKSSIGIKILGIKWSLVYSQYGSNVKKYKPNELIYVGSLYHQKGLITKDSNSIQFESFRVNSHDTNLPFIVRTYSPPLIEMQNYENENNYGIHFTDINGDYDFKLSFRNDSMIILNNNYDSSKVTMMIFVKSNLTSEVDNEINQRLIKTR